MGGCGGEWAGALGAPQSPRSPAPPSRGFCFLAGGFNGAHTKTPCGVSPRRAGGGKWDDLSDDFIPLTAPKNHGNLIRKGLKIQLEGRRQPPLPLPKMSPWGWEMWASRGHAGATGAPVLSPRGMHRGTQKSPGEGKAGSLCEAGAAIQALGAPPARHRHPHQHHPFSGVPGGSSATPSPALHPGIAPAGYNQLCPGSGGSPSCQVVTPPVPRQLLPNRGDSNACGPARGHSPAGNVRLGLSVNTGATGTGGLSPSPGAMSPPGHTAPPQQS